MLGLGWGRWSGQTGFQMMMPRSSGTPLSPVRRGVPFVVLALTMTAAACSGAEISEPTSGGESLMGGGALGGNAATEVLAEAEPVQVPTGEVAWVADEIRLEQGQSIEHAHSFSFVWAVEGDHSVEIDGGARGLAPGEGHAIAAHRTHVHRADDEPAVFWEIRLAPPDAAPPPGVTDARRVFASDVLEGVPDQPLASFVEVVVPPEGGETSVHTHPGPELIYQLSGEIIYENALIGERRLGPGGLEGIPPDTPVQKRNPTDEEAVFLSWFLLDPEQPFASAASFGATAVEGTNVALLDNGARVAAVSSNFGAGDNDSRFGAVNALDGDPASEWSSDGDGDDAFLEVAFDQAHHLHTVTVQTRTMGSTAEIEEFRLIAGDGTDLGAFELPGPNRSYPFEVDVTTDRLRFEVVSSSGGNTGLVELGAWTDSG